MPCSYLTFWALLDDFGGLGENGLVVRKVKAHLSLQAVESGQVSRSDRFGNDQADLWAKHSASRVRVPSQVRQLRLRSHALVERTAHWIGTVGAATDNTQRCDVGLTTYKYARS